MLAILSPAKTQDFTSPLACSTHSKPRFKEATLELVHLLNAYSQDDLGQLMSISEKLAALNTSRYQSFSDTFTPENSRQALLAFKGDVYTDIEVNDYTEEDFTFAQSHLRILSGLYGILRPLDLIQPYRLEMKTPLKNRLGKDLYAFWGNRLQDKLQEDLEEQGDDILVNLASNEYSKAAKLSSMHARVITPVFKDIRNRKPPRVIALFAKRARGMMANFIVRQRLKNPEDLKTFNVSGYAFHPETSNDHTFEFHRAS